VRVFVVFSDSSRLTRRQRVLVVGGFVVRVFVVFSDSGGPTRRQRVVAVSVFVVRVFVVFSHSSRPTRRQRLPFGQPRRGDHRPPRRQCRPLRPRGRQLRRPHPWCRKRARRAPARHIRPAAALGLCRDFQIWDLRGVHRRPQFRRHRGQPRRQLGRQIPTQFSSFTQQPSAPRQRPDVPVSRPIG